MAVAFVDLHTVDPEDVAVSNEVVAEYLPQRHEFVMVDRVCALDTAAGTIVAFKDFAADDWWAKGHFPDRPLVPGILMTEGAAQVATILWKTIADLGAGQAIGFGGVDHARFRGMVTPPARMFFVAKSGRLGSRMATFPTQAFVGGTLVFEATILGVAL